MGWLDKTEVNGVAGDENQGGFNASYPIHPPCGSHLNGSFI